MNSLCFQNDAKICEASRLLCDEKKASGNNLLLLTALLMRHLIDKDAYTFNHSRNVAHLSLKLSRALGFEEEKQQEIFVCGYLHDIGKMDVDDNVLKKDGKLSEDEYQLIQAHSVLGEKILTSSMNLKNIGTVVRHHHEKYDGSGYPDQLYGSHIPLVSRIIAVADAYDAMTTRKHPILRSKPEAIHEIKRNMGSQFDSEIASEFIHII